MERYWDVKFSSKSRPPCKRPLVVVNHVFLSGDRERWTTRHIRDLPYAIVLVDTEGLYRDSFIIVNALPDVTITPRGNGDLARSDEFSRYNAGNGE